MESEISRCPEYVFSGFPGPVSKNIGGVEFPGGGVPELGGISSGDK